MLAQGPHEAKAPETPAALQHEALAASRGQASMPNWQPNGTFIGLSEADDVCKREAIQFLDEEEATWYARPHPRGPFRADIMEGVAASSQRRFHWPYFVQRREWFRQHFEGFSITAREVAWITDRGYAVFLGKRNDGRMFTVNPRAPQAKEFSWNTNDIAEI